MGSLAGADRTGTVHVDTKLKVKTPSLHGHSYFVTIVEKSSRIVTVRPVRSEADSTLEMLTMK